MYGKFGNPQTIGDMVIEARNFPNRYIDYEYKEAKDTTEDICNLIKACVKYDLYFRATGEKSKKQTVFIDTDGRVKMLTENNDKTKGNSIIQYSRLKYIVAHSKNLSIRAIKRILHDRHRIKTIDIDHHDNNVLNNLLSNLRAIPHKINIDGTYDTLKQMIRDNKHHLAKRHAKKVDKEHYLIFLF
jgi:hypothetical protein